MITETFYTTELLFYFTNFQLQSFTIVPNWKMTRTRLNFEIKILPKDFVTTAENHVHERFHIHS